MHNETQAPAQNTRKQTETHEAANALIVLQSTIAEKTTETRRLLDIEVEQTEELVQKKKVWVFRCVKKREEEEEEEEEGRLGGCMQALVFGLLSAKAHGLPFFSKGTSRERGNPEKGD